MTKDEALYLNLILFHASFMIGSNYNFIIDKIKTLKLIHQ